MLICVLHTNTLNTATDNAEDGICILCNFPNIFITFSFNRRLKVRWLLPTAASNCWRKIWNALRNVCSLPPRNWLRLLTPLMSPNGNDRRHESIVLTEKHNCRHKSCRSLMIQVEFFELGPKSFVDHSGTDFFMTSAVSLVTCRVCDACPDTHFWISQCL